MSYEIPALRLPRRSLISRRETRSAASRVGSDPLAWPYWRHSCSSPADRLLLRGSGPPRARCRVRDETIERSSWATAACWSVVASIELYDPASGIFSRLDALDHGQHTTATKLLDGRVLVVGGTRCLDCAEVFDPAANAFTATSSLHFGRSAHTATLLADGKVLIVGGTNHVWETFQSAELYDPQAGTFTLLSATLSDARFGHVAVLLLDGRVLVAGGSVISSPGYATPGLRRDIRLYGRELFPATSPDDDPSVLPKLRERRCPRRRGRVPSRRRVRG